MGRLPDKITMFMYFAKRWTFLGHIYHSDTWEVVKVCLKGTAQYKKHDRIQWGSNSCFTESTDYGKGDIIHDLGVYEVT